MGFREYEDHNEDLRNEVEHFMKEQGLYGNNCYREDDSDSDDNRCREDKDNCHRDDECHRDDDCHRDENSLEFFHGLVMKAIHEFKEADKLTDKASCLVAKAIKLQCEAYREREDGRKYLGQAYQWLQIYGRRYDCNYDNPCCQRLLKKIVCLGEQQRKLEQHGLHEIKEGLAAWRKAEEIGRIEQGVIRKYIQCIHAKRNCHCRCECDNMWNCD